MSRYVIQICVNGSEWRSVMRNRDEAHSFRTVEDAENARLRWYPSALVREKTRIEELADAQRTSEE